MQTTLLLIALSLMVLSAMTALALLFSASQGEQALIVDEAGPSKHSRAHNAQLKPLVDPSTIASLVNRVPFGRKIDETLTQYEYTIWGRQIRVHTYIIGWLVIAAWTMLAILYLWRLNPLWIITVCLLGSGVGIWLHLKHIRDSYIRTFNSQLVEITGQLADAMRTGMSVQRAIYRVAFHISGPAKRQLSHLGYELNLLGVPLVSALENFATRIAAPDLPVVITTIIIQYQSGGNMVKSLLTLSDVLDDRRLVQREIAGARKVFMLNAAIMAALPGYIIYLFMRFESDVPVFLQTFEGHMYITVLLAVVSATLYYANRLFTKIRI